MALTTTRTGDWQHIAGNRRVANVTVAFDSSYPTGGESFTAADVGMRVIEKVQAQSDNGYNFEFDYTNNLLLVYKDQSSGVLSIDTTGVGNDTANVDATLMSYTLPASTLAFNGQTVKVTAWGQTAYDTAVRTVKARFGPGLQVGTTDLGANSTWAWKTVYEVTRVTATTADINYHMIAVSGNGVAASSDVEFLLATTISATTATAIQITGNSDTAYTVTCDGLRVELLSTPTTGNTYIEVPNASDLSSLNNVRVTVYGY